MSETVIFTLPEEARPEHIEKYVVPKRDDGSIHLDHLRFRAFQDGLETTDNIFVATDSWVEKLVTGYRTGGTGYYVRFYFYYPSATEASWASDDYWPNIFAALAFGSEFHASNGGAVPNGSFNFDGSSDPPDFYWDDVLIESGLSTDTWHYMDAHFHDKVADVSINGGTLQTDLDGAAYMEATSALGSYFPLGGNTHGDFTIGDIEKSASSFLPSITADLDYIIIHVAGFTGSPSDQVQLDICDDGGGHPGTSLGNVVQTVVSGNNIFTFDDGINLTEGNTYWIQISRTGAADSSNFYHISGDAEPGTSRVSYLYSTSTWSSPGSGSGLEYVLWQQLLRTAYGEYFIDPVDQTIYISQISIGTSGFGSNDLFDEDWSGGSPLDDFDDRIGNLEVVADPTSSAPTDNVLKVN